MKDWAISSENILVDLCDIVPYSLGAFLGNGYVGYTNNTYITEISSPDEEVAERCLVEMEVMFSRKYKLVKYIPKGRTQMIFIARAYCQEVYNFYTSLTNFKQEIPIGIIRSQLPITRRHFIAGLFDTDGTVKFTECWNGSKTKKNPRWQLGFSNTKRNLVEGAAAILQKCRVRTGTINEYTKQNYLTVYTIFPNLRDFIDAEFYFHSNRKQTKLQDYLHHVIGPETLYTAPMTMGEDKVQQ